MSTRTKLIVAVVVLCIALWRLIGWMASDPIPPTAYRHYEAQGARAAEVVAEETGASRGPVVLVVKDSESKHLRAREKAFEKRAKKLDLSDIEVVRTAPDEIRAESGWSSRLWDRVAREHADARAIVSFCGAPPAKVLRGDSGSPDDFFFLAAVPVSPVLDALIASGWIDVAFQPATTVPDKEPDPSASDEVWFTTYYRVETPATVPEPSAPLGVPAPGSEEEYIDRHISR